MGRRLSLLESTSNQGLDIDGSRKQMLAGGSLLLLLALIAGDFQRLSFSNASWVSIGAFFYLVVFGSLIGFTAYSWLLHNVTLARAATYAYVNP